LFHTIWTFITDCGDSAVTLPLALLVSIFIFAVGQRRLGYAWILTVAGAAGAIGALKLAFGACGAALFDGFIVSPSGHTAMSTAIYGSLALLIGTPRTRGQRYAVYAAVAVGIVGIALSRVVLHEHNLPAIVLGGAVGVGAVAAFATALRWQEAPYVPLGWLLICGVVLVAVLHGNRWKLELAVQHLVGIFRRGLPFCR
jgi:membrane-associated phospholipid phosphatase